MLCPCAGTEDRNEFRVNQEAAEAEMAEVVAVENPFFTYSEDSD
jgi:hypothetical protein